MIPHNRHAPSFIDMFGPAVIALLLVLTAYGNGEAMLVAALLLLVAGVAFLPLRFWLPALAVAGIGIAIAVTIALVRLMP